MNKFFYAIVIILAASCSSIHDDAPPQMDLTKFNDNPNQYFGRVVCVTGYLVFERSSAWLYEGGDKRGRSLAVYGRPRKAGEGVVCGKIEHNKACYTKPEPGFEPTKCFPSAFWMQFSNQRDFEDSRGPSF